MRVLYYRLLGARFVIDTFWPVELPFGNGSGESSESKLDHSRPKPKQSKTPKTFDVST
jgi:hypothetical protein